MNPIDGVCSSISAELLNIYRASDYRVKEAGTSFVMHIDEPCSALAALMASYGAQSALFISAWNPGSVDQTEEVNEIAQERLRVYLVERGYRIFAGIGEDPRGECAGEPCFLVLDWPKNERMALARAYGQNAVLWAEIDGMPRLYLTK